RQASRRRVVYKSTGMLKLTNLQSRHALAQYGFKSGLPTGFYMKVLPKRRQTAEFVTCDPGLQRALLLDVLLQLHESSSACCERIEMLSFVASLTVSLGALLINQRQPFFYVSQTRLRLFELGLSSVPVARQLHQAIGIGRVQLTQLLLETLPALR